MVLIRPSAARPAIGQQPPSSARTVQSPEAPSGRVKELGPPNPPQALDIGRSHAHQCDCFSLSYVKGWLAICGNSSGAGHQAWGARHFDCVGMWVGRPRRWRSGGVEDSPDVAGEVTLEAADRFSLALAFGVLALEVGASGRVGACAGEGDDVDRAVQLAVAAAVQPVALGVAGAGGDGGDPGVAGEARVGREALCAGGVADDDRGGDRPAAVLGQQRGAMRFDQRRDLGAQGALLEGDLSDPLQDQFRDANPGAVWQTTEPAGDAFTDLRVVQAGRGEPGLQVGRELHEVPTQPVRQTTAFGDDLVAVVVEGPDFERLLVQVRDRERVDPFSECGAGDRGRVDRIGLPRLAHCPPGCLGQPRRDPDYSIAASPDRAVRPAPPW